MNLDVNLMLCGNMINVCDTVVVHAVKNQGVQKVL